VKRRRSLRGEKGRGNRGLGSDLMTNTNTAGSFRGPKRGSGGGRAGIELVHEKKREERPVSDSGGGARGQSLKALKESNAYLATA